MGEKNQLKKHHSGQIDLDVKKIELEEINYDLDSDQELEANSELIKYEFNMIELPFFTKDCNIDDGKARKYIFSEKNKSYMMITPSGAPGLISNKIPQEFDEKIFYGILKLSREQNSQEVITDYFTLAKVSGVNYNHLERIKDSIQRLRNCKIEFNNLFYNAASKGKMDGNQDFNILQGKEEYTFKETQKLSHEKKEHYRKYFRNSKINEILVLTLANKVYNNIEHKGFLYFNQKELLEIDNATARKLFLLVTKWHGWEKTDTIKRSCRFLASRIPLSWEKSNIPGTVNVIEKAAAILKRKNLITDFILTRNKPLANSYVEFFFNEKRDRLIDYNLKAAMVTTGHEGLVIDAVEDEFLDDRQATIFDVPSMQGVEVFLNLLPEESRTEANRRTIEKHVLKGDAYIRSNILYTEKNCTGNFDAYLSKSLKDNWAGNIKKPQEDPPSSIEAESVPEEIHHPDENYREQAEEIYRNATPEKLEKYHSEAVKSSYYRFMLKDRVDKGEIKNEDALKEVSLVLIIGSLEKQRSE
jgi:hypothetical protein